jgi:hypothetical protein
VEEVKDILRARRIPGVQFPNALDRAEEDRFIAFDNLGWSVNEVAQEGIVQVRVPIRKELHLEVTQCLDDGILRVEKRRNDDGSSRCLRNSAVSLEV